MHGLSEEGFNVLLELQTARPHVECWDWGQTRRQDGQELIYSLARNIRVDCCSKTTSQLNWFQHVNREILSIVSGLAGWLVLINVEWLGLGTNA